MAYQSRLNVPLLKAGGPEQQTDRWKRFFKAALKQLIAYLSARYSGEVETKNIPTGFGKKNGLFQPDKSSIFSHPPTPCKGVFCSEKEENAPLGHTFNAQFTSANPISLEAQNPFFFF